MQVEYYEEDVKFISDLLRWAGLNKIIKKLENGLTSSECSDFMSCDLTKEELTELAGYLSLEANHNKSKRISSRACEIADYFEAQTC